VALSQLQALRQFSGQWMTLLCRVYIDVSGCTAIIAFTCCLTCVQHACVVLYVNTSTEPCDSPLLASSWTAFQLCFPAHITRLHCALTLLVTFHV
jgi:hypothetical protein